MTATKARPATALHRTAKPKSKYGSALVDEMIAGTQTLLDGMKAGVGITVREVAINLAIPELLPGDIRAIRESLGLSQPLFAEFLGASASSVRGWERGAKHPTAMGRRFLDAIRSDPDYWRAKLQTAISSKRKVAAFGEGERLK